MWRRKSAMRAELADLAQQTPSFSGIWSLLTRTVTKIRVAVCSMMLASTGTLSVPLTANAESDAAAGEKIFSHCAPCHSTKPVKIKSDRRRPASSAKRAELSPAIAILRQSRLEALRAMSLTPQAWLALNSPGRCFQSLDRRRPLQESA